MKAAPADPGRHYATRARETIARLLADQRRYLSAAAVYRLLGKRKPKVSLSTVYRTLEFLVETGIASKRIDDGGETTYVTCNAVHHHHAICSNCGRVEEIECAPVTAIANQLMARHSFKLNDHEMEFYGTCAACR
ncbi:MAG: transcriptional repressor [Candidatus Eremiobacteraeota bacterium]|nr:transcriptional repressor [Candidatus Eremiobacteraeota bacterium]